MKKTQILLNAICFIFCVLLCACGSSKQSKDIVMLDNPNTSVQQKKYLDITGQWDLTNNLELVANVENLSDKHAVVSFRFANIGENIKLKEDNRSWSMYIPARYKGEVSLMLPPPPKDKTIVPQLIRMRTDPFHNGDRTKHIDFSKVSRIVMMGHWSNKGNVPIKVIKLVAKDTRNVRFPQYYSMSANEFFPFIDKYGQFKHTNWKLKVHSDADIINADIEEEKDLAKNNPKGWNKWGGWADGPTLKATGHFRVEKYQGKWWIVDPEGKLYWSHGVVRVNPSGSVTTLDNRDKYFEWLPKENTPEAIFYKTEDAILGKLSKERGIKRNFDFGGSNLYIKYGEQWKEKFADKAHRRLKSWGLNTIANSSATYISMQRRTPYIDRIEVQGEYLMGSQGYWYPFRDPYSKTFSQSVVDALNDHKEQLDDPWCLGMFCDNELKWGKPADLAKWTIQSNKNCAAKKAFAQKLQKQYGSIKALNKAWQTNYKDFNDFLNSTKLPKNALHKDLVDFSKDITEKYFSVIKEIFNKMAPNKLYMGCRFSGFNENILRIAGKYCDVISYNIYSQDLKHFKLPNGVDKPVIIGEFHFGSFDSGLFNPSLVFRPNQKLRAQAYEEYVVSALEHPNLVGTHWHQYTDQATTGRFDGENFNVGFFTICDIPYPEMRSAVRKVGYDMYNIRLNNE